MLDAVLSSDMLAERTSKQPGHAWHTTTTCTFPKPRGHGSGNVRSTFAKEKVRVRYSQRQLVTLVLLLGVLRPSPARSESGGTTPVFLSIMRTGSAVVVQWQADPGCTQWVDRAVELSANPVAWTPIFTNIPPTAATNTWVDAAASTHSQAFYRIRAQEAAISPKIGQTAVFITRFHDVSGTAEILDAQTIRVTNFNYDATGLLVYMIVSPNSSFAPYTAISGDLIRATPYVNETLDFTIPPGTSLTDVNYISVWCVDVSVSFGDGQFQ